MRKKPKPMTILLADDDEDDRMLIMDAIKENNFSDEIVFVEDGEELLDYLCNKGKHSDVRMAPKPNLILLDLNMPRRDGREALKEIKADPILKKIPVIVFTTSDSDKDISNTYELGGNSFITKPMSFTHLVKVIKEIHDYWFKLSKLPA